MRLMLDANVLGKLCHPRAHRDVADWAESVMAGGVHTLVIPEIADYEQRREYLRAGFTESVVRLDQLEALFDYAPLTTPAVRQAAALWAQARSQGLPTASDDGLDGDVLLAAQALEWGCVVVTDNVKHLKRYCDARSWRDL